MRPSLFFAIFIPIFSIIITTIFIVQIGDKKPTPRLVKIVSLLIAAGVLTAAFFALDNFL